MKVIRFEDTEYVEGCFSFFFFLIKISNPHLPAIVLTFLLIAYHWRNLGYVQFSGVALYIKGGNHESGEPTTYITKEQMKLN